ncbi:MAG: hypothetical protein Q7S58_10570 [Candidatus Binatus sp.]|uniref:hypothetical protein n=1 Tax=Candidatus Binatus sp. TaxID=2811406 RepID=UPI002721072C|nr:hypothetical protein [Candidatus Binatus sp.]MDO8432837.1 hypothetical protein [Candidatus Binatus sp.]
MQHDFTIICEDIRQEIGRKLSLMGMYDEAIIFKRVPARLAKLCMYQRWSGSDQPQKARVLLRGSALSGSFVAHGARDLEHYNPDVKRANVMIVFAPLDVVDVGEIELVTYFDESDLPSHTHRIEIRVDPDLRLE